MVKLKFFAQFQVDHLAHIIINYNCNPKKVYTVKKQFIFNKNNHICSQFYEFSIYSRINTLEKD